MAESAEGRYLYGSGPQRKNVRRRPTLPRGPPRSTIGAEGLNFRVRNGTGCFPFAMATETLWRCQAPATGLISGPSRADRISGTAQWTQVKSMSRSQATRPISTSQLHTLPCFHLWPINPVVCWGPYRINSERDLILRRASRLDAFSGYPFRT